MNGILRPISKFENDSNNSIIDSNFGEISFHLQSEVDFCEWRDRHFGKIKLDFKELLKKMLRHFDEF